MDSLEQYLDIDLADIVDDYYLSEPEYGQKVLEKKLKREEDKDILPKSLMNIVYGYTEDNINAYTKEDFFNLTPRLAENLLSQLSEISEIPLDDLKLSDLYEYIVDKERWALKKGSFPLIDAMTPWKIKLLLNEDLDIPKKIILALHERYPQEESLVPYLYRYGEYKKIQRLINQETQHPMSLIRKASILKLFSIIHIRDLDWLLNVIRPLNIHSKTRAIYALQNPNPDIAIRFLILRDGNLDIQLLNDLNIKISRIRAETLEYMLRHRLITVKQYKKHFKDAELLSRPSKWLINEMSKLEKQ